MLRKQFVMKEYDRKVLVSAILMFVWATSLSAQAPDTLWTKTYGGVEDDHGLSVQQTADSGYIIVGNTYSFGAGQDDLYLIRTNRNGDTLWTRTYGGVHLEAGFSVQQTPDGGYVVSGHTSSFGPGASSVWLLKTDAIGDTLWTRIYGGTHGDMGYSVQQTHDGGYIVAGGSGSYGSGDGDIYLIRTTPLGDTLWTRTYGGTGNDDSFSVQQTSDDGFIVAGWTWSYGAGDSDVWLIRTDASGDTVWTRVYGGVSRDVGWSVRQTPDGGYIIAGWTLSFGSGDYDVWLIKTDENGDTLWTRTYGESYLDKGLSLAQTVSGGYIIAGETRPFGAGPEDVYLIRTDSIGDTLWTVAYGGMEDDGSYSVQQARDGGYIVAGWTSSFGAGGRDVWLIKTNPVKLISPDGGEQLAGGVTHSIAWWNENPSVDSYRLLLSFDGGVSYPDTIGENVSSGNTSCSWIVPSVISNNCRVRVQVLDDTGSVVSEDMSNESFTIISPNFVRADATADMDVGMSDAIFTLKYLYVPQSPAPVCMDAADSDDGGTIEMSDAIYTLKYLYIPGSPAPPAPGPDLTQEDQLDCQTNPCTSPFIRGDCNGDTLVNLVDIFYILQYVDYGEPVPSCIDAADANDDGGIDMSDAYHLSDYLTDDGPPPPHPFPNCGTDFTPDSLHCRSYPPCEAEEVAAERKMGSVR